MNEKVSIIVPVYNVEQYIERCIKSILSQEYINFELILVNDGSPDNSQKIIDKYKKKDKRIISIIKKNEGVSIARNCGLNIATGKYVLFVDSDDYIDNDYVSYFVSLIEKLNGDIALSYNYYDDSNILQESSNYANIIDQDKAILELYLGKIGVAVWNKIYKKEIIDKYKIRFKSNFWYAEGMTFNIEYFQKCNKVIAGNKKVYHQIYNSLSAVRKFNIDNLYCGMSAMKYQLSILESKKKILRAWKYHYTKYYFSILKGIYESNLNNEFKKEIKICKKKLKKLAIYATINPLSFKEKIKWIMVSFFPKTMTNFLTKREKQLNKNF